MAKKQKLPILSVVQIGSDDFERFVIRDQISRVWTGEQFGTDGGVLYANHNDAASDSQDILRQNFSGAEPQRLVVPLFVDVLNHDGPLPVAEVAQYLSLASRLLVDTRVHGNGPGDSLVLTRIEWCRIKTMRESPQ